jgi:uncharacterized protein YciW
MTKKDFQALATALYEARITAKERQKLANIIAAVCAANNKDFNLVKFYEAAGCNMTMKEVK